MLKVTKRGDTKEDFCAWIAMLGPPIIWLTYFEIIYARVMPACASSSKAGLLFASVICLALIAGCGFLAFRAVSQTREKDARHFMAQVGLMTTALFAILTIAQTIAMFIMDPCSM